MLRICAWCNGYLGGKADPNSGMVSHGICEHCLFTKYRHYYDKMRSKGVLPSQQGTPPRLAIGQPVLT